MNIDEVRTLRMRIGAKPTPVYVRLMDGGRVNVALTPTPGAVEVGTYTHEISSIELRDDIMAVERELRAMA